MSPETTPTTTSSTTKLCPTCGTRVSEEATRCLVCGAELGTSEKPARPGKALQGSRMPVISLSLPAALGLLAIFLAIGAVMVFFAMRTPQGKSLVIPSTPTQTVTITATPSSTDTQAPPTATDTPVPTPTPLTYIVRSGDSCLGIAGQFHVSVNSIILLNNLSVDCILRPDNKLLIPQPTPTPTPQPTATLSSAQATDIACRTDKYTVVAGDTPSGVSQRYGIPWSAIKIENGLSADQVNEGQVLIIPLCKRPTPVGATATATVPPPYAAPNLLLPVDGSGFSLADDVITLQWSSVGTLRGNEAYAVTVVDITAGKDEKYVEYVTDTKLIVPVTLRPNDRSPHIFRWWVLPVRQTGTDADGKPIYAASGAVSVQRDFSWTGAGPAITPTP